LSINVKAAAEMSESIFLFAFIADYPDRDLKRDLSVAEKAVDGNLGIRKYRLLPAT